MNTSHWIRPVQNIKTSLTKVKLVHLLFAGFFVIANLWYFQGIATVPFHPDESTTLYANDDLELLFSDPSRLFWEADRPMDRKAEIRLLDAPLRRYVVEIGRHILGADPLPVDWNWSKTWQENDQAGALPDPRLLFAGRMAVAFFFPFSLFFIYILANKILNPVSAWISAILFAVNALILLHTRRAMAEGVLVFTVIFFLWCVTLKKKSFWLIGIAAALTFAAKQSAAILFVVGGLAFIADWKLTHLPISRLFLRLSAYGLVFCLVVFLLNPYMWKHPIKSNLAAIEIRNELLNQQVTAIRQIRPDLDLNTFSKRASALLIQTYFKPPDIADIGNYLAQTAEQEKNYLANPLNHLLRGLVGGSVTFILSLFGFLIGIVKIIRYRSDTEMRVTILWLAGFMTFLALSSVVSLPFQRYSIPLIPFVCLWIGYGIGSLVMGFTQDKRRG